MCLGIPMKVVEIDDFMARCEAKGVMRDISLFILQHENIKPGDYVVVHTSYAVQKITQHEARLAWEVYDQMLDLEEAQQNIRMVPDA